MRLALMQHASIPFDIDANLETLREQALNARKQDADLIITPELFVSGYATDAFASWSNADEIRSIPARVGAIARETGVAIAASFPREQTSGTFTIAVALWTADGAQVLRYDKVHLWGDEPSAFSAAADAPATVSFKGWTVGFQVCYDIEFPEPARYLAAQGANLLIVPTAIAEGAEYVTNLVVPSRAAENHLVVAYVNHPRVPADTPSSGADFYGLSVAAGPEGAVYGRAGSAPELLICGLPDPVQGLRSEAKYLSDRRPDVYDRWR